MSEAFHLQFAEFEMLIVATVKSTVFRVVQPCSMENNLMI
jgi:hypothetical protein